MKLSSEISGTEAQLAQLQTTLEQAGFGLGGGWDYQHGYYDCPLDEQRTVFLRLPFHVKSGRLDEHVGGDVLIEWGAPFVLHHQFEDGTDSTARLNVMGALVDQFQRPKNPDGALSESMIVEAKRRLAHIEQLLK